MCVWGWGAIAEGGIATFDDLATPPPVTSATGLFFANSDSSDYQGVAWDDRVTVVGDEYRVDTGTPGPLFGIPNSGDYFITNGGVDNNGIEITTNQYLTSAWFGRNEYYGFGAGADQVTIRAMSGATILSSVIYDLPAPTTPGNPGVMGFVDLSTFVGLVGITGYRIDRRELGSQSGNWVADDFTFNGISPSAVPEPTVMTLVAAGLLVLAGRSVSRRQVITKSR